MSDLVISESTAALTELTDYRARKLLLKQRDGKLFEHQRGLTRDEIGDLLVRSDGVSSWEQFTMGLQLPHHNRKYIASIKADDVFSHWLGACISATGAMGDPFRRDLCDLAVEVISKEPAKYAVNPDHYQRDYFAVYQLLDKNADFQTAMKIALMMKKLNSYVAMTNYQGVGRLSSIGLKDAMALVRAMAQDLECTRDDGYAEIIEILDAIPDPRAFIEAAMIKATALGLKLTMPDVLRLAYVFYYKRYEYLNVTLDLRRRAAAILSAEPQFTPTEAAMADANLNLHDYYLLQHGLPKIEKYVATAKAKGFQINQRVYFTDPKDGGDKDGILITFRTSSRAPNDILAVVQCTDSLHDVPLNQLIAPTSDPAVE